MRLVSLTANHESFHTVTFNAKGPSYVVGKQKVISESNKAAPQVETNAPKGDHDVPKGEVATPQSEKAARQTYNGVGKSLLIYLINFCLGADAKESFIEKLSDWEFTLKIKLGGHEIPITRSLANHDFVKFGAERLELKVFRERLREAVFPESKDVKFLTFRSLIGLFLRPGKSAYTIFDGIHFSEKPYQRLLRSTYLLGLNVDLAVKKYELKQELDQIEDREKSFTKDEILKEYFNGKRDLSLDITELREELERLEACLKDFKVAENYHEIEQQLQEAKAEVQKVRNSTLAVESRLRQVEESLKTKHGITLETVRSVFEEVQIHFSTSLLRSLKEVEEFHERLLVVRESRLKKEKKSSETRLATLNTQLETLNVRVNEHLRFLNDHGALGELLSLKDRANHIGNQLQRLVDYKNLTKRYKERTGELEVELANANLAAERYLSESEETIKSAADAFRKVTKRLYPDKQSGLVIQNDPGKNQNRFKIDTRIHDDASDGINEAKIFAYDITVMSLARTHKMRFLCHDSRLYSDVDPRQRAIIFQIAHQISTDGDWQYIATVNEDQLEAIRPKLGDAEFKRVISDAIVLELKDDSAEEKLLGIEVDLDYD